MLIGESHGNSAQADAMLRFYHSGSVTTSGYLSANARLLNPNGESNSLLGTGIGIFSANIGTCKFTAYISNPASTAMRKAAYGNAGVYTDESSGIGSTVNFGGIYHTNANAIDGIDFYRSGNTFDGSISLYGIKD